MTDRMEAKPLDHDLIRRVVGLGLPVTPDRPSQARESPRPRRNAFSARERVLEDSAFRGEHSVGTNLRTVHLIRFAQSCGHGWTSCARWLANTNGFKAAEAALADGSPTSRKHARPSKRSGSQARQDGSRRAGSPRHSSSSTERELDRENILALVRG